MSESTKSEGLFLLLEFWGQNRRNYSIRKRKEIKVCDLTVFRSIHSLSRYHFDNSATSSVISRTAEKSMGRVQWPHVKGKFHRSDTLSTNNKIKNLETNTFPMQQYILIMSLLPGGSSICKHFTMTSVTLNINSLPWLVI